MAQLLLASFIFCVSIFSPVQMVAQNPSGDKVLPPPNTLETKIDRAAYHLMYDASWKLDTADADFDLDSYFALDSKTDNGFISFIFFDTPTDPENNLKEQLKVHLASTMKNGKVTNFTTWGRYTGKGALIKGKIMGAFNGELKIFSFSNEKQSFLIVSQIFESDRAIDQPGLDLIEKTFMLH